MIRRKKCSLPSLAGMPRFQLLIFTFVIGISLFLVVLCKCELPKVPDEVLILLGISETTYGVSKGLRCPDIYSGRIGV
jgi:hypothetical protein